MRARLKLLESIVQINPAPKSNIVLDQLVPDVPSAVYHKQDGISSTMFKLFSYSNAVFDNRQFFSQSKGAFDYGSLIHDAVLLPDLVDQNYIESTTLGLDTKAAKELRELNPDKVVVGMGDVEKAKFIAKKVMLIFGYILASDKTLKEHSLFHKDPNGIVRRVRPDIYHPMGILLDLKTTRATSKREFEKLIESLEYHVSIAFYVDTLLAAGYAVSLDHIGWICVPHESPNIPFGVLCSRELLEKGRSIYQDRYDNWILYHSNLEKFGKNNADLLFDDTFNYRAHSYEYRSENY